MFRRTKSRSRRKKGFLLDSNQDTVKTPKKFRNRFLNLLARLLFLRQIARLFRASVLFGGLFVGMALFICFAIFSPYFHIKKISLIRDNSLINVEEIENSLKDFYGKNLLFLSEKSLKNTLGENFPEFRDVEIDENWPDQITLKIVISPPLFNLLNNETANFSVISEDGVILQEGSDENLPVLKVFQYEKPIFARERFMSKDDLQKIIAAENYLNKEIQIPLKASHFYWASRELHLLSSRDMEIWIDLDQPIDAQMRKILLAADEIGLYSKIFHHIDVRVPQQIFWEYQQ